MAPTTVSVHEVIRSGRVWWTFSDGRPPRPAIGGGSDTAIPTMNPRLAALIARRDNIDAQLKGYDEQVINRSKELEGTELENYTALDGELKKVCASISEIHNREQLVGQSAALVTSTGLVEPKATKLPAEAKREENYGLVYNRESEFNAIHDLFAMEKGDSEAAGRVMQHNKANEERFRIDRNTTTTGLGGLIVPEYLTGEVVPYAREGRPFADAMTHRPLNKKTTTIPVVTSPLDVAMVNGEGTAYTSADFGTTALDIPAKTAAGYTDVSIEAVEFGSLDEGALFLELTKVYNMRVDYQTFHGSDANGQIEGIYASDGLISVTGTSATSGAKELWPKVMDACAQIYGGIFEEATVIVMTGQRWYRLLADLDSEGRALLGVRDGYPNNVMGQGAQGSIKTFANLPVILDNNIASATSADTRVLVTRVSELWLLEQNGGQPVTLKVDTIGVKSGLVTFVARGFIGFTAERKPKATAVISGLPVPSF